MPRHDPDPRRHYGAVRARVEEFIASTEGGKFYTRDLYEFCDARSDSEKAAVRKAIQRAKADGIVKDAVDGRAGCYRRIESNFKIIDLCSLADEPPLSINLPLGLDRFVEIYPKDLIVFAGVPNQGKTAFLLESVRLNMNGFSCFYFSSEMSARACAKRLSKHTETPLKDWKVNFVDSFQDYADVIQPDALNFIDYVEPPEGEYFKVPSILSAIHKKLRDGVAFVALQKNPGAAYGVGGIQTTAKPSIFCTLEKNVCRVEKAKTWNKINPNKYEAKFKIRDGINLSRVGDWTPP